MMDASGVLNNLNTYINNGIVFAVSIVFCECR